LKEVECVISNVFAYDCAYYPKYSEDKKKKEFF
jgi:hypothetical protein